MARGLLVAGKDNFVFVHITSPHYEMSKTMDQHSEDEQSTDRLDGVADYAGFTGFSLRRCYYLLEHGLLPGGKLGARWIGSKRAVTKYLDEIATGNVRVAREGAASSTGA